jgi:hypothetical protein
MKRKLRLVSNSHPGPESVFDDLETLRQLAPVSTRRQRSTETFARIPHDRGYELARRHLSASAWALLIVLDRLIFEGRGRNPVRLTHQSLKGVGLCRSAARRALRQLVSAGVVCVEQRPGQAPIVRHTWFPAS